jgi:phosphorylcholine metabolism protein LicD
MFDIYVYDEDTGELIDIDPEYTQEAYKAAASKWHHKGYAVKVVDTTDGVVVYTLGV